mgnify:CR=1 FL=1
MSKPITPAEVVDKKKEQLPNEVIDAFNALIAANITNGRARIRVEDIITLIKLKLGVTREQVYEKHYLDVEDIYREVGWKVEYDQPGYCESYDATFTFTAKKQ